MTTEYGKIRTWMSLNACCAVENGDIIATKLAEEACNNFNDHNEDGSIPEIYFEIAADTCDILEELADEEELEIT
jgi:hypothetical protein